MYLLKETAHDSSLRVGNNESHPSLSSLKLIEELSIDRSVWKTANFHPRCNCQPEGYIVRVNSIIIR